MSDRLNSAKQPDTSTQSQIDLNNANAGGRQIAADWMERGAASAAPGVVITDEIVTSDGSPVQPNKSAFMGHGYIVGSPINSGETGMFFKTYELHINQGRFEDDRTYIGSNVALSIDNKNGEIFDSFRRVENHNHELFVFEYSQKSGWNPEVEDSHLFLEKIHTVPEFLKQIGADTLPKGIVAKDPWEGSNGTKMKVGRIVDVERSGLIGDFCAIEVNLGGLSGAQGGGEALVTLAVVDEDIAAWCEKALALGRDVEINVSEDVVEMWQPSSMIVTGIKFKEESATATSGHLPTSNSLSEQQYNELKERLLSDPEFLDRVRK